MTVETTTEVTTEVATETEQTTQDTELADLGEKAFKFEGGPLDGQELSSKEVDALDGDDAPEVKTADQQTEPGDKPAEETAAAGDTTPAADGTQTDDKTDVTPKYEPVFSYKVNAQDRQFPEWVKPLVTSKETEENIRTVFQKSDAFDELKPKHETIRRERDEAIAHRDEHVRRVQDLATVRDRDLGLFLHEMGVSEEAFLRHAVKVASLKEENPAGYVALHDQIRTAADQRRQSFQQPQQSEPNSDLRAIHSENLKTAFEAPNVVQFKSNIDQKMGAGQFDRIVRLEVDAMRAEGEQGYIHPVRVAARVIEKYSSFLTPPATSQTPAPAKTTATTAAPAGNGAPPARSQTRTPAKSIPNVGKGTASSPIQSRPKTMEEVKKKAQRELEQIG